MPFQWNWSGHLECPTVFPASSQIWSVVCSVKTFANTGNCFFRLILFFSVKSPFHWPNPTVLPCRCRLRKDDTSHIRQSHNHFLWSWCQRRLSSFAALTIYQSNFNSCSFWEKKCTCHLVVFPLRNTTGHYIWYVWIQHHRSSLILQPFLEHIEFCPGLFAM